MKNYYQAEDLKTKHLFVRKSSSLLSFVSLCFVFLLSNEYIYIHLFNWWYTLILPIILPFFCSQLYSIDGKQKDIAVKSFPIDIQKVWKAKLLIGCKYLSESCIILYCGFLLFHLLLKDSFETIPYWNGFIATLMIFFSFLWQIPIYLYLSYQIGMLTTVLISITLNTIVGIGIANSAYWFIYPFSFIYKIGQVLLGINPDGIYASKLMPSSETTLIILFNAIFSIMAWFALNRITALWYKNKETI